MKMKKILALVMTGAMVLGTMSMSAFAEETEAATEAASAETTGDGSSRKSRYVGKVQRIFR